MGTGVLLHMSVFGVRKQKLTVYYCKTVKRQ